MVCSAECSVGGGRRVSPFMISGLRGVLQTAGEGNSRWLQLFYFSYLRLHVWQSLLSLITTLSFPVMKVIVKQAQPASSFLIFTIEEFHSKYRHFRQRPPIADIIYFSRIRSIIASISWYICHYKLSVSGGLTLTEENLTVQFSILLSFPQFINLIKTFIRFYQKPVNKIQKDLKDFAECLLR